MDLHPGLWRTEGDAGSLEQVMMNLSVNARDAMPDGGEISIKTQNVEADKKSSRELSQSHPGKFVCLSFGDNGSGMDQTTMERIFEPFFTTKEVAKGTGLGLSVVYGIIQQHEGWITVESTPGMGTTFRMYLPALSEKPKDPDREASVL
ncbi:MAG: ATP-binding protein [Candidatus Latescibacterota bacterium]